MKLLGKIINNKLALSDYNRRFWNDYLKNPENDGKVIAIIDRNPESKQQRRFLHGAILPLYSWLNNMNYRDSETLDWLYAELKKEFNGEIVILDGKEVLRGKSTKGLLAENDKQESGFIERVITYLESEYGIDRNKVLNVDSYAKFRDEIFSFSKYDSYIDYLITLNYLTPEMRGEVKN